MTSVTESVVGGVIGCLLGLVIIIVVMVVLAMLYLKHRSKKSQANTIHIDSDQLTGIHNAVYYGKLLCTCFV